MRNPNPNLEDEDSKTMMRIQNTIMRYHFYISDDKTHDSYFV
jgi:hypothetical protein